MAKANSRLNINTIDAVKEVIAQNLKALRIKRKISQAKLSKTSGVSIDTIRRYEQQNVDLQQLNTLLMLALALDVSLGTLFSVDAGEAENVLADIRQKVNDIYSLINDQENK